MAGAGLVMGSRDTSSCHLRVLVSNYLQRAHLRIVFFTRLHLPSPPSTIYPVPSARRTATLDERPRPPQSSHTRRVPCKYHSNASYAVAREMRNDDYHYWSCPIIREDTNNTH